MYASCPVIHTSNQCCVYVCSAGLLDAVSNFKSELLGQVIHLTWDAPPSLEITRVDPDIWYRVDISAVPTDDSPTINYSRKVSVSEFNFTMDDCNGTSTSVMYEFRVTPVNGAGNGTTSGPVTGYFSEEGPLKVTATPRTISTVTESTSK